MKKIRIVAVGVAACLALGVFAAHRAWNGYVFNFNSYDPEVPANVTPLESQKRPGYMREEFTYQGVLGEVVPVLAVIPAVREKPYPAVILLYGIGQDMSFADRIAPAFIQSGFALFVPEQFDRGRRQQNNPDLIDKMFALRRRIILTVVEARRLVDVVEERPDIDPQRIYLWGASFGAITGCAAMSFEPRFKAGVLTLIGGDFPRMVADTPYRLRPWQRFAGRVIAWMFRPIDPVRYVDKISPRPLLFQNALGDDLLPRSCVEAVYNAAGQPKEIIWYDSVHNHLEYHMAVKIAGDGLAWLRRQDGGSSSGDTFLFTSGGKTDSL